MPEIRPIETFYHVDNDGCWMWLGCLKEAGYGVYWKNGKTYNAHRYVYELYRGPLPKNIQLNHTCGFKACVNPEHLQPVTIAEHKGIHAKVTQKIIAEVLTLKALKYSNRSIARHLRLSRTPVDNIVNGRINFPVKEN